MARQKPTAGTRKAEKLDKRTLEKAARVNRSKLSSAHTKGQTVRLNREAWRQLRYLAIDHDVTQHELLLEAVNDLFRKYGKQPLA